MTDDTTVLVIDVMPAISSNQPWQSFPDMVSDLGKCQAPNDLMSLGTVENNKRYKTGSSGVSCGCLGWLAQTKTGDGPDQRYQIGSIPEATAAGVPEGSPGHISLVADIDSLRVRALITT